MACLINHQAPKVRQDAVVFANKHGVRDAPPINLLIINRALPKYLKHYVEARHHFGIASLKPIQLLTPCVSKVLIR